MAVDPLTAKILAKVAVQAATDSESRKRILFMNQEGTNCRSNTGCQHNSSCIHSCCGQNLRVDKDNVSHGKERSNTCGNLGFYIGSILFEVEKFLKHV